MKKFVENLTQPHPIYVAGVMIPPGEGREVDVPDIVQPPEEELPDADALYRELLSGSVKHVVDQLDGQSDATLQRLAELEASSETPRKTLLAAIEAEKIRRADASLEHARVLHDARQAVVAAEEALASNTDPGQAELLQQQLVAAQSLAAELGLDLQG